MSAFWPFIVIGVFAGSIYGLAAMGVVLTYKTVGVFNFAYGAVAMFCAFTYWQLHVGWHLSAWVALPVLLLVVAPVIGFAFERLFRPVVGLSAEVQIVVSLGALAALQALVPILYGRSNNRTLTALFPTSTFLLGGHLHVGYDQLGTLLVSLAMGAGLWWLLRHTRFGIATRAVVDNRDLASMMGIDANGVRRAGVGHLLGLRRARGCPAQPEPGAGRLRPHHHGDLRLRTRGPRPVGQPPPGLRRGHRPGRDPERALQVGQLGDDRRPGGLHPVLGPVRAPDRARQAAQGGRDLGAPRGRGRRGARRRCARRRRPNAPPAPIAPCWPGRSPSPWRSAPRWSCAGRA